MLTLTLRIIVSACYRDPNNTDKYFDDDAMGKAQAMLKAAMDELELDYFEAEGEAAFTVRS